MPQITVQSCHAIIEAGKAFDFGKLDTHPYVIVFESKNEDKLHRVRRYLIDEGIQHVHFYEPDIGHELTAIATRPLFGDERQRLSKYQLLGASNGVNGNTSHAPRVSTHDSR